MSFEYPMTLWLILGVPPLVGMFLWLAWRRDKQLHQRFGEAPLYSNFSEFMPVGRFIAKAVLTMAGMALLIVAISQPVKEQGWWTEMSVLIMSSNSCHVPTTTITTTYN